MLPQVMQKQGSATPYANKKWVASSDTKTCLFRHTAIFSHFTCTPLLNTNKLNTHIMLRAYFNNWCSFKHFHLTYALQ